MKYLLLCLFSANALASDYIGLGVDIKSNGRKGINLGDASYFNQEKEYSLFSRYGASYSGFNVGNGVGLELNSFGGSSVFRGFTDGIYPQIGIEITNFMLRWDTNSDSFYTWMPGISLGPQLIVGDFKLLVISKCGEYIGNLNKNSVLPDFGPYYGAGAYLQLDRMHINTELFKFHNNSLNRVDLYRRFSDNWRFGVRAEKLNNAYSGGVLWKSDLL